MNNVKISVEEMDGFLKPEKGWERHISGYEYVYDYHLRQFPVVVKVMSSIATGTGKNKGSDEIRVLAVVKAGMDRKAKIKHGLLKARNVCLDNNWKVNLRTVTCEVIEQAKKIYFKTQRQGK